MSGNDNDKARLAKLEAAFEYAGGRGVELAEEIDELRETIEREGRMIEKVLALSTAHMPCETPSFGNARVVRHEYGYIVFVGSYDGLSPAWLAPAMKCAHDEDCTLILFDRDCNEDPSLRTWDW